nr:MAG TPA_asm: hypothetical protein [Caudoviricetes sp.]
MLSARQEFNMLKPVAKNSPEYNVGDAVKC